MERGDISCFLLPTERFFIVLPQAVVVEIVRRPELTEAEEPTGWYKGQFNWRCESVALVSIEALCVAPASTHTTGSLIAIMHALQEDSTMRFYALALRAIPRSVSLSPNSLVEVSEKQINCEYISSESILEGLEVVIPNLKRIELKIRQQLERRGSM
jgi:chemosensory pili system protein ChpC